ncbi:cyanate permease [Cryobacterium mesophilum]|uniref:Uncharacterized protein n=1 Tax=Terrimesophilobacter mesophilus TaxID=433647 RepID=A0A4R8VB64_9MICO|nr:hypothetical protein [Terrimesophilobacter mesophilus]MBB5633087.1 cyanate permease [Terrimesophilobacter mesophilus]TFB79845.1 hypothetical protein E3N84_07190 [Terrimesophilobacter mesophilus]
METPSLRDRLRPLELLTISAVIGGFTGLVILYTTREWWLAGIGFGVAFILAVMMIALLALSAKPNADEREDLDEQNRTTH